MSRAKRDRLRRGGALLIVLWLSAALAAIAFSVANTVRGETERTSTSLDGLRSHYIAEGAVERALLYMLWGSSYHNPDGSVRFWEQGMPRLNLSFPGGEAQVEIIPATARLNINSATQEQLFRLLLAVGAEPDRAAEIAAGIVDWRSRSPGLTEFDRYYLSLTPSFRARHTSIEEIEELLLVKGMTPDIFYGGYVRDAEGRLVSRGGFRDCVSVYGSNTQLDINTAEPALLLALGLSPEAVGEIVQRRADRPFRSNADLEPIRRFAGPSAGRLVVGGVAIYTVRATARHRLPNGELSDMRSTVAATVKFLGPGFQPQYHVLRWYGDAVGGPSTWQ